MTTEQEFKHEVSQSIEELSTIRGYIDDAFELGDTAEITINGHRMTASLRTLGYLCNHISIALRDAQTDYEIIE